MVICLIVLNIVPLMGFPIILHYQYYILYYIILYYLRYIACIWWAHKYANGETDHDSKM